MKTIIIECRIDESTDRIGTVLKHTGFGDVETIEQQLLTIACLDNVKQSVLDKLNNKMVRIK